MAQSDQTARVHLCWSGSPVSLCWSDAGSHFLVLSAPGVQTAADYNWSFQLPIRGGLCFGALPFEMVAIASWKSAHAEVQCSICTSRCTNSTVQHTGRACSSDLRATGKRATFTSGLRNGSNHLKRINGNVSRSQSCNSQHWWSSTQMTQTV